MLSIPQHQSLYGGACTCLSKLYLPLSELHPLRPPCPLRSLLSVWVCLARSPLFALLFTNSNPISLLVWPCCAWAKEAKLQQKTNFQFVGLNFVSRSRLTLKKEKRGNMMRERWEGKCLPERQEDLPINQCHTSTSCHVNSEGLGYQTYWGGQNELMQLTSCFFSTCLPSVGRNWKSCLAKERECNLDYADWRIRAHERVVLLLPMSLFSFLHPSLHHSHSLFPISVRTGGSVEEGRREIWTEKKNI